MAIPRAILTLLILRLPRVFAANCYTDKPFKNNEPAGPISEYLKWNIGGICKNGSPDLGSNKLDGGFNIGGGVTFRIRRDEENVDLSACSDAFTNILDQCVSNSQWGGEYDYGAKYTIENQYYGTDKAALEARDFLTWVRQNVQSYKENEDEKHRNDAAAAAKATATFVGSVGGSAALIAALNAVADAQSAAAMEAALEEADGNDSTQATSVVSSTASATSTQTRQFRLACQQTQYPFPPPQPAGFTQKNDQGTTLRVVGGCALVGGTPRCSDGNQYEPTYHITDQGTGFSKTSLYSGFDSSNTSNKEVTPTCKLDLEWPRYYAEISFSNNCLRDAAGNVIYKQCCTDGTKNSDSVMNPYFKEQPAPVVDPRIKTEDCQALIDDRSIFPVDPNGQSIYTWGVSVGNYGDENAKDNGRSWWKPLASHGTCELQLVLWSKPGKGVPFEVIRDMAKAFVQKSIDTNTLPRQTWTQYAGGALKQLLAIVPTGNDPWDYSVDGYGFPQGGRDQSCEPMIGGC